MKGKAIVIDGHLVKLDKEGNFFRLNGSGVWVQISNQELFKIISVEV